MHTSVLLTPLFKPQPWFFSHCSSMRAIPLQVTMTSSCPGLPANMYFFKQTHQSGLIKPKQSASANCMPKLLLKKYMAWHAQVQQLPSQFRQCNNPMHTSSHRIRRAGSTLPVMALLLVLMSVLALSRHTNHSHAKTTTKPATTQQLAFTTSTKESVFQLGRTNSRLWCLYCRIGFEICASTVRWGTRQGLHESQSKISAFFFTRTRYWIIDHII